MVRARVTRQWVWVSGTGEGHWVQVGAVDLSADCPCLQRVLSALAALGGSDLLAPEHTLLLAQTRLRELSSGTPGLVANKATKVSSGTVGRGGAPGSFTLRPP